MFDPKQRTGYIVKRKVFQSVITGPTITHPQYVWGIQIGWANVIFVKYAIASFRYVS